MYAISTAAITFCFCRSDTSVCVRGGWVGMHLAGALWSHHLPCNIAQTRGHVVRLVEFSRPHWPFRGPELTEGSVFPSAFAFQKGRIRVCVHGTHVSPSESNTVGPGE